MQNWELSFSSLLPISSAGKSILNALPVAVYICNVEGQITFFNEAAVKLWGYEPDLTDETLRYCACFKVFADGVQIRPDQTPMAIALQNGLPFKNVQAIVERPDGTRFHATININPLFDENGQLMGAVNVFQDTSDLKEAEQKLLHAKVSELTEMEEMYHKMIGEVEDYAIILLDANGIIRNWNRGAEKIKGYRDHEIVGKSFQEFYLEEDRKAGLPLSLLENARKSGKAIHEGWRKRKDGSAFWGSIVLTALHDEAGKTIGFSKVTRDLTERKLTEDRVKEYLQQLEFQNRELEQFVYAASHDMREPLRKIHLYNSFIAENNGNTLDEQSSIFLNRSIKATSRMNRLIEDLLAYSRATSKTNQESVADLQRIIDEIETGYKEDPMMAGLVIRRNDLPKITGVPFQLKQLFFNLIDNAIKYKHPDRKVEIDITFRVVKGTALLQLPDASKDYLELTVKDNGLGFDPEYSQKIFEIFQRLIPAASVRGSGMGLAICKRIMQNHNGIIEADGVPGEGASFRLYFPQADQALQNRNSFLARS
ncbi:PAS domain-containing sensor histidine kinase [Pseudobacter ginsenosidimutans]|uniref:histidine kinase n=1 Tax=Pseudobacter ginsenosidimutans TaxID=661488 RepID=A0A4Q7N134_9BACT|nr:PAS domain-containing sensor histidine kinase [Pseudobacter ginsenosidimutans]QEC43644.1 PAS domain S-box protein [Pseudobacter ginsenosidimutans]RZS75043.1 PAS domain S-box-containing protein [Pseudobacter ginsenosidimutans]